MNRLQLCQRVKQEAGVSGTLAQTTSQTGILKSIIDWTDSAYAVIQGRHRNWNFLSGEFSFNTISGTANYPLSAVSLTDLAAWQTDTVRAYLDTVTDEQWIRFWRWKEFRDTRLLGASSSVTGRPIDFAIKPDKSMQVWPVPDDEYTIVGEYFKAAQTMTANTDTPVIPERFHEAIVWRAVMYYAADGEATVLYQHAEKEFGRIFFQLEVDQLPGLDWEENTLA